VVYLCRPARGPRREIAVLGLLIGAGIVPQLYQETLGNLQALGWALVSSQLVAALWRSIRTQQCPATQPTVRHPHSPAAVDVPDAITPTPPQTPPS
jgi:hypothetical protein